MVVHFEVESTLMKHPAVVEAAVIGKPESHRIGDWSGIVVPLKEGFEAYWWDAAMSWFGSQENDGTSSGKPKGDFLYRKSS